jgi:hypothetical protein
LSLLQKDNKTYMSYWNSKAKRLLKAELAKRGFSHEELAQKLNEIGLDETKSSIDSKISRGTFSACFLLQSLTVLGCKNLVLEDDLLLIAAEPEAVYKTTTK